MGKIVFSLLRVYYCNTKLNRFSPTPFMIWHRNKTLTKAVDLLILNLSLWRKKKHYNNVINQKDIFVSNVFESPPVQNIFANCMLLFLWVYFDTKKATLAELKMIGYCIVTCWLQNQRTIFQLCSRLQCHARCDFRYKKIGRGLWLRKKGVR